jgi:hypothetical protein
MVARIVENQEHYPRNGGQESSTHHMDDNESLFTVFGKDLCTIYTEKNTRALRWWKLFSKARSVERLPAE